MIDEQIELIDQLADDEGYKSADDEGYKSQPDSPPRGLAQPQSYINADGRRTPTQDLEQFGPWRRPKLQRHNATAEWLEPEPSGGDEGAADRKTSAPRSSDEG